jgi:hypothetical protein
VVTAALWLFAEAIERNDSRWLVSPYELAEDKARAKLVAAGYDGGEAEWSGASSVLADEETYRDHEIRKGGHLHGWLRVHDPPPPEVVAEVEQQLREWALSYLVETGA